MPPFELSHSDLVAKPGDQRSQGFLIDDVLHPFINGTGAAQIFNNFAARKVEPEYVPAARTLSGEWAVQNLSSAAGAVLTYTVAGKAAGFGLDKIGTGLGLQGGAARFLASDATAQIVGAGLFDLAKAPNPGETRLGNAAGSVTAFSVFSAGNSLLAQSKTIAESSFYTGLGRVAVGAAGGLTALETSHLVSCKLGVDSKLTWDDRLRVMASGGFVNAALPPIQKGIETVVDHAINGQPWGKGIPAERYIEYSKEGLQNRISDLEKTNPAATEKIAALNQQLAELGDPALKQLGRDNPFARVKAVEGDTGTKADVTNNRVEFNTSDGPAKLAHELKHLRMAKMAEPIYTEIGKMVKADPLQAEANFYILRANMESAARQVENQVQANQPGAPAVVENPLALGNQLANNGKTYFENWQAEWQQFQSNPKFRPGFEFTQARDGRAAALDGRSLDRAPESRLPAFTREGFLPPGIHPSNWEDFTAKYSFTPRRQALLTNMETLLQELRNQGGERVYVGGSFVTTKPEPGDFDMTWRVSGEELGRLMKKAPILTNRQLQRETLGGELMATYPNSPGDGVLGFLQKSRSGLQIGVVELNLSTLPLRASSVGEAAAGRKK
jgi:hypothetical protein